MSEVDVRFDLDTNLTVETHMQHALHDDGPLLTVNLLSNLHYSLCCSKLRTGCLLPWIRESALTKRYRNCRCKAAGFLAEHGAAPWSGSVEQRDITVGIGTPRRDGMPKEP